MRQEVVLQEKVQQQVELIEASPQDAKTGWVGLGQNLPGGAHGFVSISHTITEVPAAVTFICCTLNVGLRNKT